MNHTKGPWLFEKYGENQFKIDGAEPICTLNSMTFQSEANARLICSAPEMLEVIKSYLDLSKQMKETQDQDEKRHILDSMIHLKRRMEKIVEETKETPK